MTDGNSSNQNTTDTANNTTNTGQGDAAATQGAADSIPKAEHEAMLAKVRKEEKDKLYGTLTKEQQAKAEAEKKLSETQAALDKAQSDLAAARGTDAVVEGLRKEVSGWKEKFDALETRLTTSQTETATKLTEAQVQAHREKVLSSAGLDPELHDLVIGKTAEEIDASIAVAKKKQEAVKARVTADVRKELQAHVPKPQSHGTTATSVVVDGKSMTREQIAKLPPAEYAKVRQSLLAGRP